MKDMTEGEREGEKGSKEDEEEEARMSEGRMDG